MDMVLRAGSSTTGRARTLDLERGSRMPPAKASRAYHLAKEARTALHARGVPYAMVDRLAAWYVAEDLSGSLDDFIEWAEARVRGSRT